MNNIIEQDHCFIIFYFAPEPKHPSNNKDSDPRVYPTFRKIDETLIDMRKTVFDIMDVSYGYNL